MDIRRYISRSGKDVFGEWLSELKDVRTRAKIAVPIDRMAAENFGNFKSLGTGLFELHIDWGPGYRIYYALVDKTVVLLLCGGHKRKPSADIERAREYLSDYQKRTQ